MNDPSTSIFAVMVPLFLSLLSILPEGSDGSDDFRGTTDGFSFFSFVLFTSLFRFRSKTLIEFASLFVTSVLRFSLVSVGVLLNPSEAQFSKNQFLLAKNEENTTDHGCQF